MGMDERALILGDGIAEVVIHPHLGASIGDYLAPHPVLKTGGAGRDGAFGLGCQVLAPFANRISGGGFTLNERVHPLAPNVAGEPYPIHGNAFQSAWMVVEATPNTVRLSLVSHGPGDFRYRADLSYRLDRGALGAAISLTNTADFPLPFGLGFHPWFVRTPAARLRFGASGYWTELPDHLPDSFVPSVGTSGFGRGSSEPLPTDWINRAFAGWAGAAELLWPERGSGIRLAARGLGVLMVYSPGASADFICLEPVSHTVDAHNRSGRGVVAPSILAPGQSLSAEMTITPFALR